MPENFDTVICLWVFPCASSFFLFEFVWWLVGWLIGSLVCFCFVFVFSRKYCSRQYNFHFLNNLNVLKPNQPTQFSGVCWFTITGKSVFNKETSILTSFYFLKWDFNCCKIQEYCEKKFEDVPDGLKSFTAQKIKFFIKDFFSKCDQICRKLLI